MARVRIDLQIEETSPLVRQLIGSAKGTPEFNAVDPDKVVKVLYTPNSAGINEINPGIYYSIPSITTAKEGDTALSDDGRFFVYEEAGSRWFLWYTFDLGTVKIHTNNTLRGDGSLEDPLSVNTNLFSLKGDINPLLEGIDNGDGTYDFSRYDGSDNFTVYERRRISDVDALRNTVGRYDREQVFLEGYHPGIKGPGEGPLYWDSESMKEDNKGTVIKPDESLLEVGKCNLYFNGSNSYAIAQGDSIGLRNIQFPIRIKTRLYANQAYILGSSGWVQTDYGTSNYGLKWGIRWFYSSGDSSWRIHFFVNAPGEGVHNMLAALSPDSNHLYDIQLVEDGPDIVLIVDGEERNRLTTWSKTPTDSLLSLRFKLGEAMVSNNRMRGWVEYLQLGTEVWDFNECSGNTVTGTEGNVLDLNNIDWETLYKGRWNRVHKDYIDVQDFGALGDGATNDTDALNAAGNVLSSQGGGILSFPAGTYVVGKQEFTAGTTTKAYTTYPIINISNCERGVVIKGNGSKLIAADGLRYGSFDPVTGDPYTPPSLPFTTQSYAIAAYPCMINISNCYSVHVSDLELNGNNENLILGGEFGDKGIQIQSDGIRIIGCYSTVLDNIKSDYHPLDGIYYRNADLSATDAPTPLLMKNVDSNYNGRQGFSNTGGILGTAINCNFSHTGKGGLYSNPGAGCDFEPAGSSIRKFTFINCEFSDNNGVGFVADSGDTADVRFLGCYFIGTTTRALWADKPRMFFDNCLIAGSIVNLNGGNIGNRAILKNCVITDDVSYSPTGQIYSPGVGLFDLDNVTFEQCYIEATQGKAGRLDGGIINRCEFVLKSGTEYITDRDFALHIGTGTTLIDSKITENIQGTLPTDGYYVYAEGMISVGKNELISNNSKLKWRSWSPGAGGFDGVFADNQGKAFNRIELSAAGGVNPGNTRSIRYLSAPPTSENYIVGDVVLNNQPSLGSPTGWICTVSGSTGVNAIFEPFGEVGGSGVQTATGDGIDNSDPKNPVWSFPDPSEIGALQPGDNISELVNDEGFVDAAGAASAAPVQSVNSDTGAVVLDADDIDDSATVNKFVTAAEKSDIASAVQPGDLATVATSGDYDDLINIPPPIAPYNVFLQNSANEVENLGTTESTILNINSGSTTLSTADCAIGQSYEFTIYGANKWNSASSDYVTIRFYLNGQSTSVNFNANVVTYTPVVIKGTVNFISGPDAARVVQVVGIVARTSGTQNIIMIPNSTMTIDVTSGTTVDITSQNTGGANSGFRADSVMFNRITFNNA